MRAQIRGLLLELDVLFGGYEMGTSPQKLYEGCDLGVIVGNALTTHAILDNSFLQINPQKTQEEHVRTHVRAHHMIPQNPYA